MQHKSLLHIRDHPRLSSCLTHELASLLSYLQMQLQSFTHRACRALYVEMWSSNSLQAPVHYNSGLVFCDSCLASVSFSAFFASLLSIFTLLVISFAFASTATVIFSFSSSASERIFARSFFNSSTRSNNQVVPPSSADSAISANLFSNSTCFSSQSVLENGSHFFSVCPPNSFSTNDIKLAMPRSSF